MILGISSVCISIKPERDWATLKRESFRIRKPKIPSDPDKVACQVCFKEIPLSEALATDYALHFCGLECYAKWRKQKQEAGEGFGMRGWRKKSTLIGIQCTCTVHEQINYSERRFYHVRDSG